MLSDLDTGKTVLGGSRVKDNDQVWQCIARKPVFTETVNCFGDREPFVHREILHPWTT